MDWSSIPGAITLGISGVLVISFLFWCGHALLGLLGEDIPLERARSIEDETAKSPKMRAERTPLPDGQERLATQEERDDINEIARRPGRQADQVVQR